MKTIALLISCLALTAGSSHFGPTSYGHQWSGHQYQPAPLNHDGTVAETPEVLAARSHHLAAHAEATARASSWHGDDRWGHVPVYAGAHHQYYTPAPLNHDGTVAETPEVKAARLHHLALHAAAKAKVSYPHSDYSWHQEPFYASGHHYNAAPLNHDGTVTETPEVQAARAEHLAAHALEKAKQSHLATSYDQYYSVPETSEVDLHFGAYGKALHRHRRGLSWLWSSAHKSAPLNHDGTVAETPEVVAAKAIHFAAHAEAKARNLHSQQHLPATHYFSLHGAAPLNHDGTVAETPEVLAARLQHLAAHAVEKAKGFQYDSLEVPEGYYGSFRQGGIHRHRRSYYAPAPLNHDGTVAETPEVLAAKAAHLAAVAQARAHSSGLDRGFHTVHPASRGLSQYYSPAPLNHDGTVAETPEVFAAKAQHLAAHAEARSKVQYTPDRVHFPYGDHRSAPLNHDGTVAETPAIHAAKAHHFAAHNQALARLAHSHHGHHY